MTVTNAVQLSQTFSPIFPNTSPVPTVICVKDVEPLNALSPIVVTEFGILIEVIPELVKAKLSILSVEAGIANEVKLEQSANT